MKKSLLALSILLSTSVMADYKIIMSGNNGTIKIPENPEPQTDFVSHTFTNCGKTGRYGPSLSNCQSSYNGSEILEPEYNFNISNGIQYWTVPVTASYEITVAGAKGGDGGVHYGGDGAIMTGLFELVEETRLKIMVGQMGSNTVTPNQGSGGGGGASRNSYYGHGDGGDAPVTNTGTDAGASAGAYGNGNGAGFVWNGESALSFINNGTGGDRYHDSNHGAVGGFGGGAGDSNHLGGGGGGYNGGLNS